MRPHLASRSRINHLNAYTCQAEEGLSICMSRFGYHIKDEASVYAHTYRAEEGEVSLISTLGKLFCLKAAHTLGLILPAGPTLSRSALSGWPLISLFPPLCTACQIGVPAESRVMRDDLNFYIELIGAVAECVGNDHTLKTTGKALWAFFGDMTQLEAALSPLLLTLRVGG